MKKLSHISLPNNGPRIYDGAGGRKLTCLRRGTIVKATKEEIVRQRVLKWLIEEKKWRSERILVERPPIKFELGGRGRPDIVLIGQHDDDYLLVIECKQEEYPIPDFNASEQAQKYAQKLDVTEVWVTNGNEHEFFIRDKNSNPPWKRSEKLPTLDESIPLEDHQFEFPRKLDSVSKDIFWQGYEDLEIIRPQNDDNSDLALTLLKLIYKVVPQLPYSHMGLHILDDRGIVSLRISTPSGVWQGKYRLFLVATEGRVETAAIGIPKQTVEDDSDFRLCVGFLKQNRKHHALQLQSRFCLQSENGFEVFHDGRMGGRALRTDQVLEAIKEAYRDDLIANEENAREKRRVYLGKLPAYETLDWNSSKEFLSNIFHYAILRTNLREANPWKKGI